MKLNIQPLSQRDPRWAGQRLGTVNGITIGGYGCIITCVTMMARYYGFDVYPNQIDDWCTANSGYVQGDLYRNDSFSREFPGTAFDGVDSYPPGTPAKTDKIDHYLAQQKPVIVEVDFDHDPNDGLQTHFVLAIGKTDGGNYIICDPWYGDEINLDARYGNPVDAIYQINYFSGPVPHATIPIPPQAAQLVGLSDDEQRALNIIKQTHDTFEELKNGNLEGTAAAMKGAYQSIPSLRDDVMSRGQEIELLKNDLTTAHNELNTVRDELNQVKQQIPTLEQNPSTTVPVAPVTEIPQVITPITIAPKQPGFEELLLVQLFGLITNTSQAWYNRLKKL